VAYLSKTEDRRYDLIRYRVRCRKLPLSSYYPLSPIVVAPRVFGLALDSTVLSRGSRQRG
jgi:hypothetical protein